MTRLILCCCLFNFVLFSAAQSDHAPEISISSVNALESRTLNTDFFLDFYTGQYIDSATKWSTIADLKPSCYLGFFSNNKAEVFIPFSEKKLSLYVSGSHQSLLGIGFTPGLFQLVFTGNHTLVGQQVYMDPGNMHQYRFSTICGGAAWKFDNDITVYAAAGPVLQQALSDLDFHKSTFYTAPAADSLSLTLKGDYARAGGYAVFKGYGITAEMGAKGSGMNYNWNVSVSNIGKAWMNRHSVQSQRDTLMYFTGIELTDLSDISAVVENELDDIEEGLSLNGDTTNICKWLPMLVSGEYQQSFGKFETRVSVLYYHTPGFIPFTTVAPSYEIFKSLRIAVPLKYGGYGGFNAGIGFETQLTRSVSMILDFPTLLTFTGDKTSLSYVASGKLIYKITDNESLF